MATASTCCNAANLPERRGKERIRIQTGRAVMTIATRFSPATPDPKYLRTFLMTTLQASLRPLLDLVYLPPSSRRFLRCHRLAPSASPVSRDTGRALGAQGAPPAHAPPPPGTTLNGRSLAPPLFLISANPRPACCNSRGGSVPLPHEAGEQRQRLRAVGENRVGNGAHSPSHVLVSRFFRYCPLVSSLHRVPSGSAAAASRRPPLFPVRLPRGGAGRGLCPRGGRGSGRGSASCQRARAPPPLHPPLPRRAGTGRSRSAPLQPLSALALAPAPLPPSSAMKRRQVPAVGRKGCGAAGGVGAEDEDPAHAAAPRGERPRRAERGLRAVWGAAAAAGTGRWAPPPLRAGSVTRLHGSAPGRNGADPGLERVAEPRAPRGSRRCRGGQRARCRRALLLRLGLTARSAVRVPRNARQPRPWPPQGHKVLPVLPSHGAYGTLREARYKPPAGRAGCCLSCL